jgi:uncharacterized protein YciI
MKKMLSLAALLLLGIAVNAQKANPDYDAALAKQYEADDYGMRMYVLVILKTGSNITETKAKTDSLFAGHMANMGKLVKANKLIVAGPMGKNDKNYRGIFILNTKSLDEAKELLKTDPAVNAKVLDVEMFNWYGSAALAAYLTASEKVGKFKF